MKIVLLLFSLLIASSAYSYPNDAYDRTGIRRLKLYRPVLPQGATWPSERIQLKMTKEGKNYQLNEKTSKDPQLQGELEKILKRHSWKNYNIALIDITNPAKPRFAGINETETQIPGSTAKLLVAGGLFAALQKIYPNSVQKREDLLKTTMVKADSWCMPNSHSVPVVKDNKVTVRAIYPGDTFSLWEWLDHAISPSSNAAGTIVWREAILMNLLKEKYPPQKWDISLWKQWDRKKFTESAFATLEKPLKEVGIDPDSFRLRTFFTKGGNPYINSEKSLASPLSLAQWMIRMEQGKMVDEWSSLELKKLMYVTRRRIRYAAASELTNSAVFFKSGSLYQCIPEEGYQCGKYLGNKINILNSPTEIETELIALKEGDIPKPISYIIVVMSNELRKNAATDHALLAGAIHKMMTGLGK
jgi:hypothetical protein